MLKGYKGRGIPFHATYMISWQKYLRKLYYKIRLSIGFPEDIQRWVQFAAMFNDRAKILGKFAAIQGIYSDVRNGDMGQYSVWLS